MTNNCIPTANRLRPVGKRTPRFQTGNALEKRVRIIKVPTVSKLPNRVEEDSDSDFAAARTLVSKQTASPSASNTPSRRSQRQTSFHQNGDKVLLISYPSMLNLERFTLESSLKCHLKCSLAFTRQCSNCWMHAQLLFGRNHCGEQSRMLL